MFEQIVIGSILVHFILMLKLLKAIKGPEVLYHRKKRIMTVFQRLKQKIINIITWVKGKFTWL